MTKISIGVQTELTLLNCDTIESYSHVDNDYDNISVNDYYFELLSDDELCLLYEEILRLIDEFVHDSSHVVENKTNENDIYNHVYPFIYYFIFSVYDDDDYNDDNNDYNNDDYNDDNNDDDYNDDNNDYNDDGDDSIESQIKMLIQIGIFDYLNFIRDDNENKICEHEISKVELKKSNIEKIKKKIEFLESVYQPEQKTDEWYQHRHGLITASSVWKVFGSQSTQNQLIYEKCSPIDVEKYNRINTESSLHWGQKYEKLSKDIYEVLNNTRVQEFGCIKHPNPAYYFIGASPDGINVCPSSVLYGRMVEIKNVVSRVITGVPKEDYWIQMQVQMEVCKLPECDFLETKFVEYEDEDAFYADSNDENDISNWNYNLDGKRRGVIVYFIKNEKPFYQYVPLEITSKAQFNEWFESTMNMYDALTWIKNIYWRLDVYSCVLVLRDKEWFKNAVVKMEELWKIIESEKVTGYEHRAPKKRNVKKDNNDLQMKIQMNIDGSFIPFSHQPEKICHFGLKI